MLTHVYRVVNLTTKRGIKIASPVAKDAIFIPQRKEADDPMRCSNVPTKYSIKPVNLSNCSELV